MSNNSSDLIDLSLSKPELERLIVATRDYIHNVEKQLPNHDASVQEIVKDALKHYKRLRDMFEGALHAYDLKTKR